MRTRMESWKEARRRRHFRVTQMRLVRFFFWFMFDCNLGYGWDGRHRMNLTVRDVDVEWKVYKVRWMGGLGECGDELMGLKWGRGKCRGERGEQGGKYSVW